MGTYGERFGQGSLPVTSFQPADPTGTVTPTCDKCVAPSVGVVIVGQGASALSLEFCGHHLAQLRPGFVDRGHRINLHDER